MRNIMLALGATAMVVPTLIATTQEAEARGHHSYREWRGQDGRMRCRRSDGTTGLIVGGAAGALLGRAIDDRGDRALGTLGGAAVGALAGRAIERNSSSRHCR
ncbi:glycine zipper 2TM domain-containing protein [uncultured Sphingomonas sp.]|uniref:glycine zipper 2TM domain-containing protein n=1 Tax=uncultured Sphingomonas sp. TaxID=158754 RepID=UPI002618CAEC|nr:glycine zipper 2TM domain-containing protein [uncultured Sphingomonas sp.]